MKIFHLPDLGEGLPDAEIREWYVKAGDEVKLDQPMVAMETAKAVVDVPAPRAGRIAKLHGQAGDVIKTGAPLVEFEGADEVTQAKGTVVGNLEVSNKILNESATGINPKSGENVIKVIPAARLLAKKLNIDLTKVVATGAGGQITLDDIEKAAGNFTPSSSSTTATVKEGYEPVRGVRRSMISVMSQSHSEVVPITLMDDADIHAWPAGTDITLRVIRALTVACAAEPALNAWFDSKAAARRLHKEIHLGLAIDSPDGLFVPVLKDVANSSAEQLRTAINTFKEQVKNRTVSPDDLKGATFVLSNVGIYAGRYASPIIVPPTVAILATGRIRDAVVAYEGAPAIHRVIPLSLSIDHRVITGGETARFLTAMIKDLELRD